MFFISMDFESFSSDVKSPDNVRPGNLRVGSVKLPPTVSGCGGVSPLECEGYAE